MIRGDGNFLKARQEAKKGELIELDCLDKKSKCGIAWKFEWRLKFEMELNGGAKWNYEIAETNCDFNLSAEMLKIAERGFFSDWFSHPPTR